MFIETKTQTDSGDLLPMPPRPADLPAVELTENARKVLVKRYVRRGPDGQPAESVEEMFWRVAYHVARCEEQWENDVQQQARNYYDLLTSKRFFPNSPTFTGAGTPLGQLAACFVLKIVDDMGRDPSGIFQTLRDAALIQQTGGGNGFAFSRLRPKGALVKSSAGQATGPVGFLRVYDKAFGEVAQGGSRRGANMAVLRVDHPDIEEFITCKTDENAITNFNISVGITDAFMRAVERDEPWELRFPDIRDPRYKDFSGTLEQAVAAGIPLATYKTVRARELFDKIVAQAHHNGEPGVLFLDAANRSNPVPHLYQLEATNPCVTGDTLIYTGQGLRRADELAAAGAPLQVAADGRFGTEPLLPASPVFPTGIKDVFRLTTHEGYELRLTADHPVMTARGWVGAGELKPGDEVHILNRKGGFGPAGTLEEGQVLGWLVGDGTLNAIRAVLSFFGAEKVELAPHFAQAVTALVDRPVPGRRAYPVGVVEVTGRDEARVMSERLGTWAAQFGLRQDERIVPAAVLAGSEAMQRGFLQALFSADGQVNDGGEKGCSVRLSSSHIGLLKNVQQLLLNFGIASRIYANRRPSGYRDMPDGHGGTQAYAHKAQHDLAISRTNLIVFAQEIGFLTEAKQTRLAHYLDGLVRGPYQETFTATVLSVEPDGTEPVYDLQQADIHAFVANGIVVHNCGEQFLGSYENCCLGSVNLAQHFGPEGAVDWEKLRQSVALATTFLDDVVEANAYVPAVPQLKEAAHRARRIGLGIMGLGDLMYHAGIRYGSEEGQEFGAQVMEFVRYHAMKTSIELARLRGAFPAIGGSIYDPERMIWQPPQPLAAYSRDWGRPALDWETVRQGILQHGIRNAAQTTVAPTGTIATVAGCEGYGCEPVFALAYLRHVNDNGKDLTLNYASPAFEQALVAAGLDAAARQRIVDEVMHHGSCQKLAEVPAGIRHTFVVSADISADEHVRMQGALQAFVDNSLSKCVTGDTLILTDGGLVPISSLSEMRLHDQFEPHELTVHTPEGPEKSDFFFYGGMRETRRVELSYGYEVEGTPNHRVHALLADGQIDFIALGDLQVGDTVLLYANQQSFGPSGAPLPAYTGEWKTRSKRITFPERMSPELAYVLGCITSEGSIYKNGVQICNGDLKLLEKLGELFRDLFGLDWHITKDPRRESVYSLQINSRPLRYWLLTALDMETGARNKLIPDCILRAGRSEVVAYLRGLFLDAYMTRDGRMFGIGLASRGLVRQLQTLMLNFGVFSSLHPSAEHAWALTVSGEALDRLAAFIEFDEVWKNQRIQIRGEGRTKILHNYGTLLPDAVTQALRSEQVHSGQSVHSLFGGQTAEYQRSRVNLLAGHRLERSLAQRLDAHFTDTQSPYLDHFFAHDREGILYVKVEKIETGFQEVFDLSVPGSHAFIANGLCNHNTVNFPSEATPEDVATAYQLAWEQGCKGITVYVTGSRQKVVLETKATAQQKAVPAVQEPAPAPAAVPAAPVQQLPIWHETKKPRPRSLKGYTYTVGTPLGKAFITINENGGNQPFEIFINTAKAGSDTAAVSEAIGRLISYILRLASPIAPRERLKEVLRQLAGIGGGRSLGFGPNRVRSLPDGVAQVLSEYIDSTDPDLHPPEDLPEATNGKHAHQAPTPTFTPEYEFAPEQPMLKFGDLCPECGQAAVINEEGCRKCYSCGFSEC